MYPLPRRKGPVSNVIKSFYHTVQQIEYVTNVEETTLKNTLTLHFTPHTNPHLRIITNGVQRKRQHRTHVSS
jgi:hypothetical protein